MWPLFTMFVCVCELETCGSIRPAHAWMQPELLCHIRFNLVDMLWYDFEIVCSSSVVGRPFFIIAFDDAIHLLSHRLILDFIQIFQFITISSNIDTQIEAVSEDTHTWSPPLMRCFHKIHRKKINKHKVSTKPEVGWMKTPKNKWKANIYFVTNNKNFTYCFDFVLFVLCRPMSKVTMMNAPLRQKYMALALMVTVRLSTVYVWPYFMRHKCLGKYYFFVLHRSYMSNLNVRDKNFGIDNKMLSSRRHKTKLTEDNKTLPLIQSQLLYFVIMHRSKTYH